MEKRVKLTTTVKPSTYETLRAHAHNGVSQGMIIDTLVEDNLNNPLKVLRKKKLILAEKLMQINERIRYIEDLNKQNGTN